MGSIPIHILSSQEGGDLMAIVTTKDDSVFDLLGKLQNSGFEIIHIIFSKSDKYYSISITNGNRVVKIVNFGSKVIMLSNDKGRLISDEALIYDDLLFKVIK